MNKKHQETFLKDYAPPYFFIETADLKFILDPKETIVKAKLHITRNRKAKNKERSLTLDGTELNLKDIKIDKKILSDEDYQITDDGLTILKAPNDFVLETTVSISPKNNLTCSGLYLSNNNFTTQNEPHGFRRITYFLDRPDILTKFTTTIVANKKSYPELLSNGNLISKKQLKDGMHQVKWEDPFPKPAYLFALVAGKFSCLEDFHTTKSGRKVTLRIYAEPKQLDQCHHAMFFLKQAMTWEEKEFDLEYDLDLYQIVAINDFNFGAMENKGLNIFNSKVLLASKDTATDNDLKRIAAVIAHEYFHNWTGNRVSCRDWFQVGLKEGLTTLREQLFMEDLYGQAINRIDTVKTIYNRQFPEDAGPLAHPIRLKSYIEVDNFYTTTIYYKSSEIARMLITTFGRKTFRKIMKKFLTKYDGKPVTIEDFIKVAAAVTKTDLEQFKRWYDQPGTPLLKIRDEFKSDRYCLKIEQEYKKTLRSFFIPLRLNLISHEGQTSSSDTLIISGKSHLIGFKNITTKQVPSLLHDFSAPVKIDYPYTEEELLLLVIHDKDPISRWEASQKLMIKAITDLYNKRQLTKLPQALLEMFKTIINDQDIDPSLASQMLELPPETNILSTLAKPKIEKIHEVYSFIKTEVAKELKEDLLACHHMNKARNTYSFDTESVGKRDLKNTCLGYLMQLNTADIYAINKEQLEKSDNLTDIFSALIAFANSKYKEREKILEQFYKKWSKHPNLINKWLTINAQIKDKDNLKRIKKLLKHPAFKLNNPNNVYALIRAFAESNLIGFHDTKGEGYKFLADQIITVDKFNPMLAAMITAPLTTGHRLDNKRKTLLEKELRRISKHPTLSSNVYEIATKTLLKK